MDGGASLADAAAGPPRITEPVLQVELAIELERLLRRGQPFVRVPEEPRLQLGLRLRLNTGYGTRRFGGGRKKVAQLPPRPRRGRDEEAELHDDENIPAQKAEHENKGDEEPQRVRRPSLVDGAGALHISCGAE